MMKNKRTAIRHAVKAEILTRAVKGDGISANEALKYLSSTYPGLRRIVMGTICDLAESSLWERLLGYLPLQCWDAHEDWGWSQDKEASERINQSIAEVFRVDEGEGDKRIKQAVLPESLHNQETPNRQAAGYLLGLHGDLQDVPILPETIETGPREWKLLAIRVLAASKDEICRQHRSPSYLPTCAYGLGQG